MKICFRQTLLCGPTVFHRRSDKGLQTRSGPLDKEHQLQRQEGPSEFVRSQGTSDFPKFTGRSSLIEQMQANTMIRRPALAPATDKINQIPQQECIAHYCLSVAVCSPGQAKPYLKENSSTPDMKSTIASPKLCKAEVFKNIAILICQQALV
jgi:hypothetical protein